MRNPAHWTVSLVSVTVRSYRHVPDNGDKRRKPVFVRANTIMSEHLSQRIFQRSQA